MQPQPVFADAQRALARHGYLRGVAGDRAQLETRPSVPRRPVVGPTLETDRSVGAPAERKLEPQPLTLIVVARKANRNRIAMWLLARSRIILTKSLMLYILRFPNIFFSILEYYSSQS